ncbi:MAG: hypothetical protein ABIE55_01695 [Candidatus Aenigmatarchaeota archaeon]
MTYMKKLLIGSLVYIIVAIVIAWFLADFAIYAIAIGALIAGIYMGRGATPFKGAIHGLMAGLVGGIIGGTIGGLVPVLGIPLGGWLNDLIGGILGSLTANPWYALPQMALVGLVLGLIGGFIGAKLRR